MKQVLVSIGEKYAKSLGYEEHVGSLAAVIKPMTAIIEVQIILGPKELIGSTLDIHKEDAVPYHSEENEHLYAVADYRAMKVYYTTNEDIAHFIIKMKKGDGVRKYKHILLDSLIQHYSDFTIHNVDDEKDTATKVFRDTFQSLEA